MIVLWILLGLAALVWLALELPLRIYLHYEPEDGLSYCVKYLFFTLADSSEEAPAAKAAPQAEKPTADRRTAKKLLSFLGLEDLGGRAELQRAMREKGTVQTLCDLCAALHRLLSDTFALVRKGVFRHFALRAVIGDSDPADAAFSYGKVCAAVYPLATLLGSVMKLKHPCVDLRCDYTQEETTVFFDGQILYRPRHFVGFLFRLFANYLKKERKKV